MPTNTLINKKLSRQKTKKLKASQESKVLSKKTNQALRGIGLSFNSNGENFKWGKTHKNGALKTSMPLQGGRHFPLLLHKDPEGQTQSQAAKVLFLLMFLKIDRIFTEEEVHILKESLTPALSAGLRLNYQLETTSRPITQYSSRTFPSTFNSIRK